MADEKKPVKRARMTEDMKWAGLSGNESITLKKGEIVSGRGAEVALVAGKAQETTESGEALNPPAEGDVPSRIQQEMPEGRIPLTPEEQHAALGNDANPTLEEVIDEAGYDKTKHKKGKK